MWRKPSKLVPGKFLKLSVYVDDNIIAGPDKPEMEAERAAILKRFNGRAIEMKPCEDELGPGWVWFDILGADLYYNQ